IEQNGFTYRISDGIYFDTSRFSDYGAFARLDLQQLKEGARIGVNPEKKNQTDFALWKFSLSTNGLTRQMEWDSPWGRGVPGWHVECTAMSIKNLGFPFDVHVGGVDHIAVHHTNEIAQSYGAFGRQAVNYWLHNGFVTFKGEKVSKSKGGLWTITELEKMGFEPLAYRYLVLTSHYRSGLDFSLVNLKTAQTSLNKLRNLIKVKKGKFNKKYLACFKQFLENDLAMPEIIALVWQIVKEEPATVLEMDKVLGLNLAKNKAMNIPEEILELVNQRRQARAVKDWVKADKLREMIRVRGYDVEDTRNDCKIKKLMLI
ncbi:MAG TPA: cysteine--tRNA ligase, partial [Candidatus Woesebacteria bacterium]|nr:cysteine--tRNA ligase [Candidatus Woesebacteria bacterium]